MLSNYISQQLHKAKYKLLEDGTYFGEIPGIDGVWADNATLEDCRNELRDVLESWIVIKLQHQEAITDFDANPDSRDIKAYA